MSDSNSTLTAKDVCEIITTCKDQNVKRIRFQELEIDFCGKDIYSDEKTITEKVVTLPQDKEETEQHDSHIIERASREQELDLLRVTDPVAYDLALQQGDVFNDEEDF